MRQSTKNKHRPSQATTERRRLPLIITRDGKPAAKLVRVVREQAKRKRWNPEERQKQDRLTRAIEAETRFGVVANFKTRRAHDMLDADWSVSPITKQNKDKAWSQLGTSGSGNHFVESGLFTAHGPIVKMSPSGERPED